MYIDNKVFLYKTFLDTLEKAIAQRKIEDLKNENEKLKAQLTQKNNLDKISALSVRFDMLFRQLDNVQDSLKRERHSTPGRTGDITSGRLDVAVDNLKKQMIEIGEELKKIIYPGYPYSNPD